MLSRTSFYFIFLSFIINSTAFSETFYISKVKKSDNYPFYDRFVTLTHHVVVTPEPIKKAIEEIVIFVENENDLYLIDPNPHITTHRNFVGEVGRIDRFVFVVMPAGWDPYRDLSLTRDFFVKIGKTLHPGTRNIEAKSMSGLQFSKSDFRNVSIDDDYLMQVMGDLSGENTVMVDGRKITISERGSSNGRALTRSYLKAAYESLGYSVGEHPYKGSWGSSGVNFIAEKIGSDRGKMLILASHYDSANNPGADDNGSGMAALLAIAESIKDQQFTATIRFAYFDQEERGLLGSSAYARYLNGNDEIDSIIGVINLDMMGYDGNRDFKFHLIDCDENESYLLSNIVMQEINDQNLSIRNNKACTDRSDHASFWKYNLPAIMISEDYFGNDYNPCYHKSCDRVDKIDFTYLGQITRAVVGAVVKIAR